MSASVSPRQQARRTGPTVIFPSGRHDQPRLWPALSLAVAVCAALVVLSARLSNGGIPRRPARAVPPPTVPAVPDPAANDGSEPEIASALSRPEPEWSDDVPPASARPPVRTVVRAPARAPTRAAVRAPVRRPADEDAADPEREAIEREDATQAAAVAPPPAVVPAAPAPQPPPVASLPPARLFVSSQPWGRLYIDGQFIGNTPRLNIPVTPGRHRIRVSRDGYTSFDTTIAAQPETMMRLTGITLREWTP